MLPLPEPSQLRCQPQGSGSPRLRVAPAPREPCLGQEEGDVPPSTPALSGAVNNHGKNEKDLAVKVVPNWICRQLLPSTSVSDLLKWDPEERRAYNHANKLLLLKWEEPGVVCCLSVCPASALKGFLLPTPQELF